MIALLLCQVKFFETIPGFFLCEIHPITCQWNAGLGSFGVLKTSFCILKTSFSLSEKQFLILFKVSCILLLKILKISPFPLNFDNKNAIKRVTPCNFLCQIIFCKVELDQNCRKIEFHGKKSSFKGKKSSFGLFGKIEFPSKRTKKSLRRTPVAISHEHCTFT